ncbi:Uncharacterized protein GBIM_16192 [Gryllus bimaculatus]|nr:Uncharacterized protein GBIM_16192 [Gryllus bimaculatus]
MRVAVTGAGFAAPSHTALRRSPLAARGFVGAHSLSHARLRTGGAQGPTRKLHFPLFAAPSPPRHFTTRLRRATGRRARHLLPNVAILTVRGDVCVVPGPPAAVRAALSSPRSALVVWLPPAQPNGVLLRYHVYQREVRRGDGGGGGGGGGSEREREPARHAVNASATEFEARPLSEQATYMWWVSAETQVGEGPSSTVVDLTPSARVPPPPPSLSVVDAGSTNLTIRWTVTRQTSASVLKGFILAWREITDDDSVDWHEERLPKRSTQHVLGPLLCGSEYELAAAAINQVGRGELGHTIRARTRGGLPEAPSPRLAISAAPRSLTVHLERWRDAHCPISHFVLERTTESGADRHWTTVTDHAPPGSSYMLSELSPATFYWIRVTAFNNRGSVVTEFKVSTLTVKGVDSDPGPVEQPVLSDLRVSLPIAVSALALVLTLVTAAACLRRKPVSCPSTELPVASDGGNFLNKPDYFSALRKKPEIPPPPTCENSGRIPEYVEDIYPYATFQAQKPVPQVSSQRGFQTFVYQGSGLLDVDSYASREEQPAEYAHATAMRSDTEEYDSLGSDSDSRVDDRSTQFHPTYHHSNIRHSMIYFPS